MAEYIDRDKLRELLLNIEKDLIKENGYYDVFTKGFGDCVWQVENFPAADVVEVVRCKDCKHCVIREYDIIDELECEFFDVFTDPLDYCSRGERRADNG